ncbi:cytochrome c biogenesis protein CcsA [Kiloniella sp. b19]|uniref:cytochrome c biogenesis protein CcsA n=1 Tax=Kiloniella sp. GXU_MW_B19 TaxID=3141326 RepID=UPI0031CDEFC5
MSPALLSYVLLPLLSTLMFVVAFAVSRNRDPGAGMLVTLAALTLIPLSVLGLRLEGGWDRGLGTILWAVLSATLLLFGFMGRLQKVSALSAVQYLDRLVLGFAALFSLAAFLSDWVAFHMVPLELEQYALAMNWALVLHIVSSMIAYACAALAAIAAVAVILRSRSLKNLSDQKRDQVFTGRLPSLFEADEILVLMLKATAVVLLMGIATGIYDNWLQTGELLDFDHKTILSLLSFAVIGLMLIVHSKVGIYGKRAVQGGLLMFMLISLGVPGVKLISWLLNE